MKQYAIIAAIAAAVTVALIMWDRKSGIIPGRGALADRKDLQAGE